MALATGRRLGPFQILAHVVRGCLAKDPAERWQSARDVVRELEWVLAAGSGAGVAAPVVVRRRWRERLAWGLVVAAVATAVVALVALHRARRPTERRLVRFAVTAPGDGAIAAETTGTAVSPDGRQLVLTVVDPAGIQRLWIRPLDSFSAQPLPGTEGAICPFWSPDSRLVAFFSDGKLRKVPAGGGSPEVICDAPNGRGGSWSSDGVIVFAPQYTGPLFRVSAAGGEAVEVARPDPARGETGLRFPCFLPDGRHFLYVSLPRRQAGFDVYLGALDSREHSRLMAASGAAVYAEPGYLLFGRGDRLLAQRFDAKRLRPEGDVAPLGALPPTPTTEGAPSLSASSNGVLVQPPTSLSNTRLVWLDRAGRPTGTIALPSGSYGNPSLSPDGRSAVVAKANSPTSYDLWTVDLQRAVATRLTFDGSAESPWATSTAPLCWSPDSSRIAFTWAAWAPYDIYQVAANGAGQPEPLVRSAAWVKSPAAWSPDGMYLVFSEVGEGGQFDLWVLPLRGDRKPVPYLRTPFDEYIAAISPDGRWLAYDSNETGTPEIYVRSFPVPGEKHRVSTAGGLSAQWSRDGRELIVRGTSLLLGPGGPMFSVDVETTPTFKAGTPRLLFTPRQDLAGITATSDLKRFVAAVPVDGAVPASLQVTLNWHAALER